MAPYVLDLEKQARTVDVETGFVDPHDFQPLLPGYSADVEVVLDRHENVLRIPTEALLENQRVLLYHSADGLLEERKVKIGLANWQYSEVTSGLSSGDLVVLSIDREGVKPGAYAHAEEAM